MPRLVHESDVSYWHHLFHRLLTYPSSRGSGQNWVTT